MPTVLLLSGPIASGKTTFADELIARHGFMRLKSSGYLRLVCEGKRLEFSRSNLQYVGDTLDGEPDYRWLIDSVAIPQMASLPQQDRWLIDSVRKARQCDHFRAAFGRDVYHAHLWAPESRLRQQFDQRLASGQHFEGATSYDDAICHPNEISARALKDIANLVIDVSEFSPTEAANLVMGNIAGGL